MHFETLLQRLLAPRLLATAQALINIYTVTDSVISEVRSVLRPCQLKRRALRNNYVVFDFIIEKHLKKIIFGTTEVNFSFTTAKYSSPVDIGTGYRLDGRSSIPGRGKRLLPIQFGLALGLPNLLCYRYLGLLSAAGERPGRDADHSPPSSAEVKNSGTIPPLLCTPSWSGA
jgi:hypothetical protein